LDAQEFAAARKALAPYTASPRKRVAALMAELEMAQGDEGRAREWMARALNARRDPAWTADAFVSDHWLPISPVSGRLDAFEWKDPLAGEHHGPVIEHRPEPPPPPATIATREATPARPRGDPAPPRPGAGDEKGEEESRRSPFVGGGGRERSRRAAARADESRVRADMTPIVPAVIPLVHAPDDPGPNGDPQPEPEPEIDAPPAEGWRRIRALFK